MNRSCFHANRGYLIGVTVIVLCLLAVLHPGTKARLTFSKEVRPSLITQSTPEACAPISHSAYLAQGQRARNYGQQLLECIGLSVYTPTAHQHAAGTATPHSWPCPLCLCGFLSSAHGRCCVHSRLAFLLFFPAPPPWLQLGATGASRRAGCQTVLKTSLHHRAISERGQQLPCWLCIACSTAVAPCSHRWFGSAGG